MRLAFVSLFCSLLVLVVGCSSSITAPATSEPAVGFSGSVHEGQQPYVNAEVFLFAAGTSGYGGPSISLLKAGPTTILDANNLHGTYGDYYVLTGGDGTFSITGDYSCTPSTQIYLYVYGGRPAGANILANTGAGFLAALGSCPVAGNFLNELPFIAVNEVSTVATAYAIAGFATDAIHVSSSGTALAQTGIASAFANVTNLESVGTGGALASTPAGNGTVPQTTINYLANILAYCVNSNDVTNNTNGSVLSKQCQGLLATATSDGTSTGNFASDTANAAINIAHHPAANVASLFALASSAPPFTPFLSAQPNDWTVGLNFSGGGMNYPRRVAIDTSGNAWIANQIGPSSAGGNNSSSVTELSGLGAVVSGSPFTGGGLQYATDIAIDSLGHVWVTNSDNNSVTELSNNGLALSGPNGITGGGLSAPQAVAIDGSGNVWVGNEMSSSITKISSSGSILSGTSGYSVGGGVKGAQSIAIDGSGDIWIANHSAGITKLSGNGSILSGSNGYTGGGMNAPGLIAVDGSGYVWTANVYPYKDLSELSNSGVALSGPTGYTGGGVSQPEGTAIDGSGNVWVTNLNSGSGVNSGNGSVTEFSHSGSILSGLTGYASGGMYEPDGIAVDGSGDVWMTNYNKNSITEIIGSATPVITPICAGLPTPSTSDGSSKLGTRP